MPHGPLRLDVQYSEGEGPVTAARGVNLGMFHYHFRSREAFMRALLQGLYEEMYAQLGAAADGAPPGARPIARLREALRFMGRFVRDNFPRHLAFIERIVEQARDAGDIRPIAVSQAMGFCAGSLAAPILFGGAVLDLGGLSRPRARARGGSSHAGITVLVGTHYMDEAERCHALAYIASGRLLASGRRAR